MEAKFLSTISLLALISACNANSDSYTLYKTTNPTTGERIIVKLFNTEKTEDDNGRACFKQKVELTEQETNGTQYWCEKGGG